MKTVDAYHPLYNGGSYGGTSIGKEQEEKATVEEPSELMITKFKPNFDDDSDKNGSLSHSIGPDRYRWSGPDLWTEDKEFLGFDDEDEFNKGYRPYCDGFPYIERVDLKSVTESHPYINIKQLLKLAIQEYNKKNGTNYMLVHINKANKQMWGCGFNFFVTFQASAPIVDDDHHDAPTATFQALLWEGFFGKTEVRFCRPKKNEQQPITPDGFGFGFGFFMISACKGDNGCDIFCCFLAQWIVAFLLIILLPTI